jgi:rhomboid protease GluP
VSPQRQHSILQTFPTTVGLLVLIALAFLAEQAAGGATETKVLVRLGANFPPLVLEAGQWWRLLTSTILHIGFLHLAMNGWALWQLGRLSEITFGSALTLALFVFTGITGSLLTLLQVKISAGASGALFGLEGALVAFFLRHRDRLTPAGKQILGQLLLWSAFMIVFSFSAPGIDWLGHLGGFFGGLAVGWALPPQARDLRWPRRAAVFAGLLLALSIAFGALFAVSTRSAF